MLVRMKIAITENSRNHDKNESDNNQVLRFHVAKINLFKFKPIHHPVIILLSQGRKSIWHTVHPPWGGYIFEPVTQSVHLVMIRQGYEFGFVNIQELNIHPRFFHKCTVV